MEQFCIEVNIMSAVNSKINISEIDCMISIIKDYIGISDESFNINLHKKWNIFIFIMSKKYKK